MSDKGILINGIIGVLNQKIKADNKILCKNNLHSEQKQLHGADMFFDLVFMDYEDIKKIAAACGL